MAQFSQQPLRMRKPIPASEVERTEEVQQLLARILPSEMCLLTTWEYAMVGELREGKASTKIRVKELRDAVERIEKTREDAVKQVEKPREENKTKPANS